MSDQPVWNTKVAVVMNLNAPDAASAITRLARALRSAGTEPMKLPIALVIR